MRPDSRTLDLMDALGVDRARLAWRTPVVLLLAIFGIIVAAGGWAGTTLLLRHERAEAVLAMRQEISARAGAIALRVENSLQILESVLLQVRADDLADTGARAASMLENAVLMRQLQPRLRIFQADEATLAAADPLIRRVAASEAPELMVGAPLPLGDDAAERIPVLRRIADQDRRTMGVAVASVRADALLDGGGVISSHSVEATIRLFGIDGAEVAKEGNLVAVRQVSDLPLVVAVSADVNQALAPFKAWRSAVQWAVAGASALWLAVIAMLARAFSAQEAARREAQAMSETLQQVFEASPINVQIKDAQLRYVWTNQAHAERTGWSLDRLRGKRPDEIGVELRLAEAAIAHDQRVLDSGQAEGPIEQMFRHPDGTMRVGLVTKMPLWRNGRITHIVTTGSDVTEIRQAQTEAENARRLLEDVINNVPAAIHVKGDDFRYRWVNRQFAVAFGRDPAAMVGLRAGELRGGSVLHEETMRHDSMVFSSGQPLGPYETEQQNGRGEHRYLLMTKVPLRDVDGRVTQILTVSVDITARRRAEQALQRLNHELEQRIAERTADLAKANELLSKIISGAPIPIITFDRDARVTSFNGAAERTTGYAASEVIGGELPTLDEPGRVQFTELAQRIARGESFHGIEARRWRKDGQALELVVAGAPLFNALGEPDGAIGIWLDVTEQRAVERQLQQAQKMEAVGQVTGGIAHDFNNLLSVVIGNLDMALESASPEEMADMLREALAAAERSADLTQRLLAFARPQIAAARRADPSAVITGMRNMLATALGTRIRLLLDLPADSWPIEVDVPQLESCILNLCLNARDAMPDGGSLTARVRNAPGDGARPDWLCIDMIDTGCGMPPDIAEKAFEPFFTTKQFGRGSGLGLSMVYAFARRSGGEATIDSMPGHGTTVTLRLPRSSPGAKPPIQEQPMHRPMGRGETILVVEDNEALRDLVEQQLAQLGYCPVAVANGDAALQLLTDRVPADLLFTDIVMPGSIDGRGLAQAALELRPGLRCLLTSGYEHADPTAATMHLPVLAKPYRRDELARAVRQALDQPPAS